MKRYKWLVLMSLVCATISCGCMHAVPLPEQLTRPGKLFVIQNVEDPHDNPDGFIYDLVRWDEVEHASGYILNAQGAKIVLRTNYFYLRRMELTNGVNYQGNIIDYADSLTIQLQAVTENIYDYKHSDWSEEMTLYKPEQ